MKKKRFIARDENFGYSIWKKKPTFREFEGSKGFFITDDSPGIGECHYVSEELAKMLMGADFSLNIGECVEFSID